MLYIAQEPFAESGRLRNLLVKPFEGDRGSQGCNHIA